MIVIFFFLQNSDVEYQSEKHALSRTKGLLPVLPHREMEQPFRGLLASQMECQKCGFRNPIKYDAFDSLSLNLPSISMVGYQLLFPGKKKMAVPDISAEKGGDKRILNY